MDEIDLIMPPRFSEGCWDINMYEEYYRHLYNLITAEEIYNNYLIEKVCGLTDKTSDEYILDTII